MIIITGANGFIGAALVFDLNKAGYHDLICVDSVPLSERNLLAAKPFKEDSNYKSFFSKEEIWSYLDTPKAVLEVEAIVHMGACSSTLETNVEFLNENNVEYTKRLWAWCTKNQKTFIYASSAAVYGDGALGFDDIAPPEIFAPLNPYGESKAAFDRWAVKQTSTPPTWVGLRFFNVYGADERHKECMRSVVCKAYDEILDTGKLKLFRSHHPDYKDGMQLRDFVYIKDITRWIIELLPRTDLKGIFNMGFGEARTWLDLARSVFQNMNKPFQIEWVDIPMEMRPRYQYFTKAKIDRLLALKLSHPRWPLEKGIEDYIQNYLKRG
jgi:ADP-L-glycero-D-manno-heptose 6-epimerase